MPLPSKIERLILSNQYRIMEMLDPDNARDYERYREAIDSGYESAVENLMSHIFDGLDAAECTFAIHAMDMFLALQRSYAALADKTGFEEHEVVFPGFDGNNETEYMAYCRFVVDYEQRFTQLATRDRFNSHAPMIAVYRRMLPVWEQQLDGSHEMNGQQMRQLLDARRYRA